MSQNNRPCIINISFEVDGLRLSGVLHLPAKPGPPLVVGCHGLMADKASPKQIALAEAVNRLEIAYFRFDHRGCGQSEGDFAQVTTLNGRCRDLTAAVETVRARFDLADRLGLFGSSMGGAVCLASAKNVNPAAMVTLAAPLRLGQGVTNPPPEAENSSLPPEFFTQKLPFDISARLAGIKNILILHGDADPVVPVKNGHEIYKLASAPKDILLFRNGDHRISDPKHQHQFIAAASRWFGDHLNN